ncbi:hypothetical protein [Duganella sp. P38]|uniref:hypothetical protein n=1 Tax=Duganella sp. P38 TaxID=3423949 RepID=UPI003D7AC27B
MNFDSWYRLIDLAFADPAKTYRGNVQERVIEAVRQARKFHCEILKDNYHPKTYVFYGADHTQLSYGSFRWKLTTRFSNLTESMIKKARLAGYLVGGGRRIQLQNGIFVEVTPSVQDVHGDGTVPYQSGIAPAGKVKQVFATQGYSHQGSYSNSDMLALTRHLIVKLMQDV